MGMIRGGLLVLISVLLFISFLLTGVFGTLNSSLNYDNVQPKINPIIKEFVQEKVDLKIIKENYSTLKTHCNNNTSEYEYKDQETNNTFVIPCDTITQGPDAIIDYEINYLGEKFYYEDYSCKFWGCFKEVKTPFFLVSQHAKDYWKTKYYFMLFISALLIGLVFLLVENKINFPILAGILLATSSILVAGLDTIGKMIAKVLLSSIKLAVESLSSINLSSLTAIFFSSANNVSLVGFILGLILIALGIFLKLLKTGFKIKELFSKINSETEDKTPLTKKQSPKTKKKVSKDKKGEVVLTG